MSTIDSTKERVVMAKLGFLDNRNPTELFLAPYKPLARNATNLSTLQTGNVSSKGLGVVTSPDQLSGAVRSALEKSYLARQASLDLTKSFTSLSTAKVSTTAIQSSATASSISNPNALSQFSSLSAGVLPPSTFTALIEERKKQLQTLVKRTSGSTTSAFSTGVTLTENYNRETYPLAKDIDVPSLPRLAQGGSIAAADETLRDKAKFVISGVPIASGKPSYWNRFVTTASLKTAPNFSATTGAIFKDKKYQSGWSEPASPYNAQFPYNKVQQTESGHIIELDDTPGAERVHVFHRSGSFVEFHPDGTVVMKQMKNGYSITMGDNHIKVGGNCHIAVDGNATIFAKKDLHVQTDGSIFMQAKKDFEVYADNISLNAKKKFKADGTTLDLRYVQLPGTPVAAYGGLVPKLNISALKMDFPGINWIKILAGAATLPLDARAADTETATDGLSTTTLAECPLANPSIYEKKTTQAVQYRARMFDSPDEIADMEMYAAHCDLQKTLKDFKEDPRILPGEITQSITTPAADIAPTYLNFDDYRGKFDIASITNLAGTSVMLSDLIDTAKYSDIKKA